MPKTPFTPITTIPSLIEHLNSVVHKLLQLPQDAKLEVYYDKGGYLGDPDRVVPRILLHHKENQKVIITINMER